MAGYQPPAVDERFIVTGTGRCGTKYVATLLQVCGIEVRHEKVWGVGHPDKAHWGELWGEVGWEAAAHLADHKGPIVHLVRDPVAVINSRMTSGWYQPELHSVPGYHQLFKFVDDKIGLTEYEHPLDRAVFHYLEWNRMIENHDPNMRVAVEEMSSVVLQMMTEDIGHPRPRYWCDFAVASVPPWVNKHTDEQMISWDTIKEHASPGLVEDLKEMAYGYGYLREA